MQNLGSLLVGKILNCVKDGVATMEAEQNSQVVYGDGDGGGLGVCVYVCESVGV